jgi:hypothetical protein
MPDEVSSDQAVTWFNETSRRCLQLLANLVAAKDGLLNGSTTCSPPQLENVGPYGMYSKSESQELSEEDATPESVFKCYLPELAKLLKEVQQKEDVLKLAQRALRRHASDADQLETRFGIRPFCAHDLPLRLAKGSLSEALRAVGVKHDDLLDPASVWDVDICKPCVASDQGVNLGCKAIDSYLEFDKRPFSRKIEGLRTNILDEHKRYQNPKASQAADDVEIPQDGPHGLQGFAWKGAVYEGLQAKPWKLVEQLWNRPGKAADFGNLAGPVWQDHAITEIFNRVRNASRRATEFFANKEIPLEVAVSEANRRVAIQEVRPPEN